MQVKKFEAPTLQEALDTVKRELGPEAVILQTKKNKRGFGLMSRSSVEVTAAVSERSIQKKKFVESRLPEPAKAALTKMGADRQSDLYNQYADKHLASASATKDRVEMSGRKEASSQKRITQTPYIDISDDSSRRAKSRPSPAATAPAAGGGLETYSGGVPSQVSLSKPSLEEELRHLKRMLQDVKSAQETAPAATPQGALESPLLQDAFDHLVINGMEKRYALALIKKINFELSDEQIRNPDSVMDQLAVEIMEATEVQSPLAGLQVNREPGTPPQVLALVGPTGVGKTTTIAKIASEALLKRGLKVGMINLDNYKVAAFDQLGTYAKILNVPFRSASSEQDVLAAIQDFHGLDLILIDTTGRSQRDPESLKDLKTMLDGIPELRTQLVLSATTRDTELYDMANRFLMFRPQGITISKLDEATTYGSIYNVSQRMKMPLLYFTTGQRVPEDIEESTKERVVSLILEIE